MNQKNLRQLISVTILLLNFTFSMIVPNAKAQNAMTVEGKITEDELNTRGGLSWSGGNFPWSRVLEIQDSLVSTPVGRIVMDKHTEGGGISFIGFPPEPGRRVFITLWGAKIEGCYVELIYQIAPQQTIDAKMIVAEFLEVGIEDKIVRLIPQQVEPRLYSVNYTYNTGDYTYNSTWYMVRQLFVIDEATANILSNAPNKQVKARIRFVNEDTKVFPIGQGTVQRWKDIYKFNPSCKSSF